MSFAFDVYYKPPRDDSREAALMEVAKRFGGWLDRTDDPTEYTGVCLTYDFHDCDQADAAAEAMRKRGEHVEGPYDYGP